MYDARLGIRHYHALLVLRSAKAGGDLLLRSLTDDECYLFWKGAKLGPDSDVERLQSQTVCPTVVRYAPAARSFETLSLSAWASATEEVCACDEQRDPNALTPFTWARPPLFDGKPIRTAGQHFCSVAGAPNQPYIAVVSADGELVSFFMSPPRPTGPYYQQIFSKASGQQIGEPVKLPFSEKTPWEGPCWSCDGRFIVYVDFIDASELWIVETNLP